MCLQEFLDVEVPKLAEGYPEVLQNLLRQSSPSSLWTTKLMDKLPHRHPENGIVYVGDAWHPMSPFSGMVTHCEIMMALGA